MFILDTNVVSEIMRPAPVEKVFQWIAQQPADDLFLTAISEAELRHGAAILPRDRRRESLQSQIDAMLKLDFAGRILPFDGQATEAYAVIASERRVSGLPISMADCQIAAIARSTGAKIATRDMDGFRGCGVHLVNPWMALPID